MTEEEMYLKAKLIMGDLSTAFVEVLRKHEDVPIKHRSAVTILAFGGFVACFFKSNYDELFDAVETLHGWDDGLEEGIADQ